MQVPTPDIIVYPVLPLWLIIFINFTLYVLPTMLIIGGIIKYRRKTKESTRIWD